jgi:hypothetical protein
MNETSMREIQLTSYSSVASFPAYRLTGQLLALGISPEVISHQSVSSQDDFGATRVLLLISYPSS